MVNFHRLAVLRSVRFSLSFGTEHVKHAFSSQV